MSGLRYTLWCNEPGYSLQSLQFHHMQAKKAAAKQATQPETPEMRQRRLKAQAAAALRKAGAAVPSEPVQTAATTATSSDDDDMVLAQPQRQAAVLKAQPTEVKAVERKHGEAPAPGRAAGAPAGTHSLAASGSAPALGSKRAPERARGVPVSIPMEGAQRCDTLAWLSIAPLARLH